MALQECTIHTDEDRREVRPHGTIEFPCAGYDSVYSCETINKIPWHWHEDLEVIYLKSGTLDIRVPGKTFRMKPGDSIIINSNILHEGETSDICRIHSLVFHPDLIAGSDHSVFYKKYIYPLINSCSLDCVLFSAGDESGDSIRQCILKAFDALSNDREGYEFTVRECLSRLCFLLCKIYNPENSDASAKPDQDSFRIKEMIHMIQSRYTEPVKLCNIAQAANIGERECLRCFRRTLGISPMQYLIRYRLSKGALLLMNTNQSISEISTGCGFDSPSNFSQMFKRVYQCSPREYRKNHKTI